jgi:hypothetical protein
MCRKAGENEQSALMTGDMRKIESWLGEQDERLNAWLMLRLSQQNW